MDQPQTNFYEILLSYEPPNIERFEAKIDNLGIGLKTLVFEDTINKKRQIVVYCIEKNNTFIEVKNIMFKYVRIIQALGYNSHRVKIETTLDNTLSAIYYEMHKKIYINQPSIDFIELTKLEFSKKTDRDYGVVTFRGHKQDKFERQAELLRHIIYTLKVNYDNKCELEKIVYDTNLDYEGYPYV